MRIRFPYRFRKRARGLKNWTRIFVPRRGRYKLRQPATCSALRCLPITGASSCCSIKIHGCGLHREPAGIMLKLILASSSPRRAEILREAGIAFQIRATEIDETALPGETALEMVARLAEAKARAAAQMDGGVRDCIVVGAD